MDGDVIVQHDPRSRHSGTRFTAYLKPPQTVSSQAPPGYLATTNYTRSDPRTDSSGVLLRGVLQLVIAVK